MHYQHSHISWIFGFVQRLTRTSMSLSRHGLGRSSYVAAKSRTDPPPVSSPLPNALFKYCRFSCDRFVQLHIHCKRGIHLCFTGRSHSSTALHQRHRHFVDNVDPIIAFTIHIVALSFTLFHSILSCKFISNCSVRYDVYGSPWVTELKVMPDLTSYAFKKTLQQVCFARMR